MADATPHVGRGAGKSAAVGMEHRVGGQSLVQHQQSGRSLRAAPRRVGPARSHQPSRFVELAVSGRAEVEPVGRMTPAMRGGISARDDGLHLVHRVDRRRHSGGGGELAQRGPRGVGVERNVADHGGAAIVELHANRLDRSWRRRLRRRYRRGRSAARGAQQQRADHDRPRQGSHNRSIG